MFNDQKRNNRSQGQRIRRTNERVAALAEGHESAAEVLAQHDRDLRMLKARVAQLERERQRQ